MIALSARQLHKAQVKMIVFILTTLALSVAGLSTAAAEDDILSDSQDPPETPVTTEESSDLQIPELLSEADVDVVTNVGTGSELVNTTAGNNTVAMQRIVFLAIGRNVNLNIRKNCDLTLR